MVEGVDFASNSAKNVIYAVTKVHILWWWMMMEKVEFQDRVTSPLVFSKILLLLKVLKC